MHTMIYVNQLRLKSSHLPNELLKKVIEEAATAALIA
jgi:hypothetical protein